MIAIRTINWSAILATLSNDHELNWESHEGPESRVGVDYFYKNPVTGDEAWINMDQNHVQVHIGEELVWEGEEDELQKILPRSYNRVSAHVEDLDDTSKVSACLLTDAEVSAATHTFEKFGIPHNTDSLNDPTLYTLDLATSKGGTYQELRTGEEIITILEEVGHLTNAQALQTFRAWTQSGESPQKIKDCEIHLDETTVPANHTEKPFGDIVEDPDMVGQSSYRAAADLAAQVSEEASDASDVEKNTTLDQEKLEAIDTEMSELIAAALLISTNTKA